VLKEGAHKRRKSLGLKIVARDAQKEKGKKHRFYRERGGRKGGESEQTVYQRPRGKKKEGASSWKKEKGGPLRRIPEKEFRSLKGDDSGRGHIQEFGAEGKKKICRRKKRENVGRTAHTRRIPRKKGGGISE